MSERLEEMLRIARAATKGPWIDGHLPARMGDGYDYGGEATVQIGSGLVLILGSGEAANAQHIATFNPRTAEALVKVALAAEDEMQFFPVTKELREALFALTAAMEDSNVG